MEVRKAVSGDLDAVVALRARLWPEISTEEHRREAGATLAGHPRSTLPLVIFVADDGGRVIGFVEVGLRSHADGCDPSRPCGFVEGWYVAPEHRGRGVGGALIRRAETWAEGLGCAELASDTWIDNEESQRAHAALGFEVVDRCVNFRKQLSPRSSGERPLHYGADLARVHHDHFGMVARAAARELLARLSRAGISSGTIVDLAAGSGILSRGAVAAGFDVWGVDLSEDMLRIARAEASAATFVAGSLWSVNLPPCVAVAAAGEAFSYAADPVADPPALEERLAATHRALAPGGLLLFDVAGPGRSGPDGSRRVFWTHGQAHIGVEEHEDRAERRLTRAITLFVPEGDRFRRTQETHSLRLYAPEDVGASLTRIGFAWERLHRYDDFEFPPGWHAYAAVKTAA
jgi:aminoglycoside 6'-N-acetyltransferase I